jgi:hypothetical protein
MARNRKNQSVALRFGPVINVFVLCLLVGGSGVGYVWQKNQIYELGQQIKQRELRLHQLEDQNDKLNKLLASMRSPASIIERIEKLNLGLGPPQPGQVCVLEEPPRELPKPDQGLQVAGRSTLVNSAPEGLR